MPTVHFVSRKLLGELLLLGKHGLPWEIKGITKKPKTIASTSSASAGGEASSAAVAASHGADAARPPPAPPGSSESTSPSGGKICAHHESRAEYCQTGRHGLCIARKSSVSEKKVVDNEKGRKPAATFLDRVESLRAYKEKHGHFRVLGKEDRNLYDFCYRVRRARREGGKFNTTNLNEQRIAALDAIGFDWEMKRVVLAS